MQKESELFLLNVVIKVIRGADNSQSLSAPLVVFSLITYHFSLITSLQHAYTARRSQRCQHRSQNRYNYLYHRLPCLLLHSLNFQIINFKFQTSIFKLKELRP